MISPNVIFAEDVFLTVNKVEMSLKKAANSNIMLLLKSIFYFECQETLQKILNDAQNDKQVAHLYVECPKRSLDTFAYGRTKMVVKRIFKELWDRNENDGYWLVLVFL